MSHNVFHTSQTGSFAPSTDAYTVARGFIPGPWELLLFIVMPATGYLQACKLDQSELRTLSAARGYRTI